MMFGIISVILEAIPRIFNIIWSIFCGPIYYLISIFYEVFLTLPRINILRDLNIEGIYQRVTMILVIVMAFYITFEVVKYVVQPDIITDKEKGSGKLVQKIIIVILLIAFVPKIFDIAYELQGRIIRSDIFAKVLLDDYKESDNKINNMGGNFAANVYGIFYHVNEDVCPMTDSGELDTSKISQWNLFNCQQGKMIVDNNMMILRGVSTVQVAGSLLAPITALGQTIGLNLTATNSQGDTDFVITFNGLLALGVGVFILWTLIVYGVELAKRVFQLIYLQIIAPVAIISYIAPKKDGMLSKWTKQCITTYLDLFIRLAIINFILLIISLLHESFFDTDSLIQSFIKDWGISPRVDVLFWVYIFLIFGLFTFAKKAPKMLSELFPSSGAASSGFGIGMKEGAGQSIRKLGGAVIGATAIAAQGVAGGIKQGKRWGGLDKNGNPLDPKKSKRGAILGGIRGGVTGVYRGAKSGYKDGSLIKNVQDGMDKQSTSSREFGNRMENNYGIKEQMSDRYLNVTGQKSRIAQKEEEKAPIERQSKMYDKVFQANKAMRDEAKKHVIEEGAGRYSGEYKEAYTKARDLREDSTVKAQFTVGKYTTKEAAYDAYVEAVKEARATVNRQNFVNVDGTLNSSAYENACSQAASKIKQEDFTVSKYKTQQEAEEAYRKALAQADANLDAAEKKAINDYIDNGEWNEATNSYGDKDKKIQQIQQELAADFDAYNLNATKEDRLNAIIATEEIDASGNVKNIFQEVELDEYGKPKRDGSGKLVVINKYDAKEFHKFAKAQAEKKSQNATKITAIDAEIEKIKRQTEGSGIKLKDNK